MIVAKMVILILQVDNKFCTRYLNIINSVIYTHFSCEKTSISFPYKLAPAPYVRYVNIT